MVDPRKTPLYDMQVKMGGKIVNFEDWMMPVKFEGVIEEHKWTRQHAGIFDISHMTEFMVEGPDTIPLLKTLMTNSVGIGDFKAQYNHMCYPDGGVVDDLYIYRESAEKVRIIANAQTLETEGKDFNWIKDRIGEFNATITDLSLERTRLAFQGPDTMKLLNPLTKANITEIKRFNWIYTEVIPPSTTDSSKESIPIFLSRTGYTGEDDFSPALGSFEISCDNKHAEELYKIFLDTGAKPIGLGARDSLRLECCYALYGNDINAQITTIEAGLGWVVKEKEGIKFIGQEVIMKQKAEGAPRTSVGLNLLDKGILRAGYKIFKDSKEIGYVTSGTFAPTLEKTVGLALISPEFKTIGTEIDVQIRNKLKKAVVVKTPFYSRGRNI
ncbi:MAG: glycine cleavage system aminomethyltransferase GcvT [Promethearchaeota archaeon]